MGCDREPYRCTQSGTTAMREDDRGAGSLIGMGRIGISKYFRR